ncbi:hypothetical protein NKH77_04390 [Streptomyces sp. M19]
MRSCHRTLRTILVGAATGALLLTGCSSSSGDGDGDGGGGGASTPVDGGTLRYAVAGSPATASDDPHGGLGNESDLLRFALVYDVLTVPGADGARTAPRRLLEAQQGAGPLDVHAPRRRRVHRRPPVRAADVLTPAAHREQGRRELRQARRLRHGRLHRPWRPHRGPGHPRPAGRGAQGAGVHQLRRPRRDPRLRRTGTRLGPVPGGEVRRPDRRPRPQPRWWGPRPHLDRVEIQAVADPQARAAAVTSGQADVAGSVSPRRSSRLAAAAGGRGSYAARASPSTRS